MDRISEIFADEQRLSACAAIRVKFLRDHGLLWPDRAGTLCWVWWRGVECVAVEAVWAPDTSILTIAERRSGKLLLEAQVLHIKSGRQSQTFIIDPKTGARSTILYYVDGVIGSREVFGVPYPSRRLTPALRREQRLQTPDLVGVWPKPPDPEVMTPKGAPVAPPRPADDDLWSTQAALENGADIMAEDPKGFRAFVDRMLDQAEREPPATLPVARPWPADQLETGI